MCLSWSEGCATDLPIFDDWSAEHVTSRVMLSYLDDLDGSEASETVEFGLDGDGYEIDLSPSNARALRALLSPYVGAARRLTAGGRPFHRVQVDPDPKIVRTWAANAQVPCPNRGRIPREVVDAFEQAHAS